MTGLEKTMHRFGALIDGSAWMLIAPALFALMLIDPPMAKTLLQWSLYFSVLVGLVVMVSRIAFPHIRLQAFIDKSLDGSVSASIVVLSIVLFVALLVIASVLWARPAG